MRRSVDGGATWTPTRFLVNDPLTTTDGLNLGASVFDERTGKVFVHYGVCGHSCAVGATFVLSSTDRGLTWATQNITTAVAGAGWKMINAGPGTGVQLPSTGRLAVAVWGELQSNPSHFRAGALLSDDGGNTWRMSKPVPADSSHEPNECQLAIQSNGSLLMNVRDALDESGCRCRVMTRSDDGGGTWTELWRKPDLTGPICQGSMIRAGDALVYSAPQSLEGRSDGYIKASLDDGETWWIKSARLDDPKKPGFGYSGLVDVGGGAASEDGTATTTTRTLGVVYEPAAGHDGVTFKLVQIDFADLVQRD